MGEERLSHDQIFRRSDLDVFVTPFKKRNGMPGSLRDARIIR